MQQDNQIKTLQDNLNKLIENAPAGFLPQTYYGLVEGETQTYRADQQTIENVALPSAPAFGKVYALTSPTETEGYVPTYIAFVSGSQTQNTCEVIIKGDYNKAPTLFDIVDMSTGEVANSQTIAGLSFSQQAASYVGEYSPKDNYNHQITALHDVSFNEDNVVYASIDVNSDGVYNWVKIGNYRNGITGSSVRTVTGSNFQSVISSCLENDILLAGEDFTADDYVFNIGDLYTISTLSPLVLTLSGNIRGAQGATGATGTTGADGITPSIVDGYWYLGTTNTNVKAEGKDGQNGVDGNSFSIQTPLYSAPNNVGVPNNVDPQGNALETLPTLPQTDISGKAYVVYDPLTTPLTPFYDLYYANNNDTEWTIIHPYTGLAGKNGVDGLTPSIQNGYWHIGGENTGVNARGLQGPQGIQGPQGPQGPQGEPGVVGEFSQIDFAPSTGGLVYSNGKATYTGTFSLEDTESNQYTSEGQVAINIEAGDNVTIDADETNTNLVINATGGGSTVNTITAKYIYHGISSPTLNQSVNLGTTTLASQTPNVGDNILFMYEDTTNHFKFLCNSIVTSITPGTFKINVTILSITPLPTNYMETITMTEIPDFFSQCNNLAFAMCLNIYPGLATGGSVTLKYKINNGDVTTTTTTLRSFFPKQFFEAFPIFQVNYNDNDILINSRPTQLIGKCYVTINEINYDANFVFKYGNTCSFTFYINSIDENLNTCIGIATGTFLENNVMAAMNLVAHNVYINTNK